MMSENQRIMRFFEFFVLGLLTVIFIFPNVASAENDIPFAGGGTKENPYLIETYKDLMEFRDLVNGGDTFKDCWFLQTADINLRSEPWTPIGISCSGNYFYGVYNGGGHSLRNLRIEPSEDAISHDGGLFGQLAGTVLNLGIESGDISGKYMASFAAGNVPGASPAVINCYSKAAVKGERAGGIVDNFVDGVVINCWYGGELEGEVSGRISTEGGLLIDCYGMDVELAGLSNGRVVRPCAAVDMAQVTLESQRDGLGFVYAQRFVDYGELIAWEWNEKEREFQFASEPMEALEIDFEGNGTKEDPFLIADYEDLCLFRNLVNSGEGFEGIWFRQTEDITMETDDWLPIGVYGLGNYFWGTYDGAGHIIDGLSCKNHGAGELDNNALFGQLGGVVVNLGLENVSIEGECCGSIASHGAGTNRTAAIINCYARGRIHASRPGGIVDNLNSGTIANCLSDVKLSFTHEEYFSEADLQHYRNTAMGGISALSVDTKVYGCQTTAAQVMPESHRTLTSAIITAEEARTEQFINELNIRTALAQELFGDQFGVELMQWQASEERMISFSEEDSVLKLADFLNQYLLVGVLGILMLLAAWRMLVCRNLEKFWERNSKSIAAVAVITGVIALFVDCAAIGVAREYLRLSNMIFIAQINLAFAAACAFAVRYGSVRRKKLRVNWTLLIGAVVLLALQLLQFDTIPRYDAALYYGSLARGAKLFRLDFLSYIGAFVCWKWAQGTALLVGPIEFLMPGEIVGLYIANAIIVEVTLAVLYCLFREYMPKVSSATAALASFLLVLCPFQLGMFTYLCFDMHCVYYAVWLMYAYRRKNYLLTAFSGYLLFFSKISGGVFYVIFLIAAAMFEVLTQYKGNLWRRILKWWSWPKVLLWIFPAVLYLISLLIGEHFTIQHFNGANLAPSIAEKAAVTLQNTLVQAFIFGFRWLFVLIILCAAAVFVFDRYRLMDVLTKQSAIEVGAMILAGASVIGLLLLYNSDAECPRYTALMNVVYAVLMPVSICVLFKKEWPRRAACGALAALLLVQTYWTIDPSIILHETHIDTGTNELYRLALDDDDRPGMNLGADYSDGYRTVGDIYAYNIEYNYYDDLISRMLEKIDPDEDDLFYVLDVIDYELHLRGNQYLIYWNTRTKRSTYNGEDPDSILLRQGSVTTDQIVSGPEIGLNMGDDFYLVVPARVDTEEAMQGLAAMGYELGEELHFENIYGSMYVYHMQR